MFGVWKINLAQEWPNPPQPNWITRTIRQYATRPKPTIVQPYSQVYHRRQRIAADTPQEIPTNSSPIFELGRLSFFLRKFWKESQLTFMKRCFLAKLSYILIAKTNVLIFFLLVIFYFIGHYWRIYSWIYPYPSRCLLFVVSGIRIFEDVSSHKVCMRISFWGLWVILIITMYVEN